MSVVNAGASVPREDDIRNVMDSCGCDKPRAIHLLIHSNNDPEGAALRHRLETRIRHRVAARMQPHPVQLDNQHTINPSAGSKRSSLEYHSDDQDLHSGSDEDPLLSSPQTSQRSSGFSHTVKRPFDQQQSEREQTESSGYGMYSQSLHDAVYRNGPIREPATSFKNQSIIIEPQQTEASTQDLVEEVEQEPEWDFILPKLPKPLSLTPGVGAKIDSFELRDLLGALQHGTSQQVIRNYIGYYERSIIRRHANETVEGFPAMFYVVAMNDDWIIRTWVDFGGDVNAVHEHSQTPLLAFAIMHSETIETDTTNMVATLLSLGALPAAIPVGLYSPFCKDLPADGLEDESLGDLSPKMMKWLTKSARKKLARTTNLTHRFNLERAAKTKRPSIRHRQVARIKNAEALFGLPYFLIGQSMAASMLVRKCLTYLTIPSKRPLVLCFAGPSGHGKTELARRLGHLMSLELEVVDCAIVSREMELFGARHPYTNAEQGSPLNNFLARNSGRECIVVLDEFEKTTREIHQSLLLPFGNGEYQDRRNQDKIDCTKTIWILATNALDATIQGFCKINERVLFHSDDDSEKMRLMKTLSKQLKADLVSQFDAPITGRISAFLPFLPFSRQEQAVVVHKFLLELAREVRSPVNLQNGPRQRFVGNVRLHVRRDATVSLNLAADYYHEKLGARPLMTAVEAVREELIEYYLSVEEHIAEGLGAADFVIDVNAGEIMVTRVYPEA